MPNDMKILYVASEALPFASTGGLADVIGSLPAALTKQGVDARVVIPLYKSIKDKYQNLNFLCDFKVKLAWRNQYCGIFSTVCNGVTFYFVDNEYYFNRPTLYGNFDDAERYAFFSSPARCFLPTLNCSQRHETSA